MDEVPGGLRAASGAAPQRHRDGSCLVRGAGIAGLVLTGGNDLAVLGGDAPERDAVENALLDWAERAQAAGPGRLPRHAGDSAAFRDSVTPRRRPCGATSGHPNRTASQKRSTAIITLPPSTRGRRSMSGRSPTTAWSKRFAIRPSP
jgi:hypothetical protein